MTERNASKVDELLGRLPRFADRGAAAYEPGLDRMQRLLALLDHPEKVYDIVHVAGTNGKGSTASMVAAIARAAGHTVGLHTSPHLFHVAERMRVDGLPAAASWLSDKVGVVEKLAGESPSYFELTTALSLLYFAEQDVDLAVIEVGMGGRLDATNVVMPVLSIITEIGLDHTEFLGETLPEIAREKAGIVKQGVPVVTSAGGAAAEEIRAAAASRQAPFHAVDDEVEIEILDAALEGTSIRLRTPEKRYERLYVGMPGRHQIRNAAAAVRAAEILYAAPSRDVPIRTGLRHAASLSGLKGRFEILRREPLVVADVAHNSAGLETVLGHATAHRPRNGRLTVLLGVMRDKDVHAMAAHLKKADARVRPVVFSSERALPARELASLLEVVGITVEEPASVQEGVHAFLSNASPSDMLVITGSHLVVSELESVAS